jgi:hypothetical protein
MVLVRLRLGAGLKEDESHDKCPSLMGFRTRKTPPPYAHIPDTVNLERPRYKNL